MAGKIVTVTGASSGIGLATASRLAGVGATVAMLSRNVETGQHAASSVARGARFGGGAVHIRTDVTCEEDVRDAVAQTVDRFGRIDGMFNGAGISGRAFGDGPVDVCTLDGWDAVIGANLTSMFLCCKYGIAAMLDNGAGSVVNLSSVLGMVGGDADFATHAYAASKGGIISLTRAIASYYAPRGIRANVICPGLIRTKMSRRAQENPAIIARLPALQPLTADFGAPEDVANAARFLLSDEARFITGEVLTVDGGWTVR